MSTFDIVICVIVLIILAVVGVVFFIGSAMADTTGNDQKGAGIGCGMFVVGVVGAIWLIWWAIHRG